MKGFAVAALLAVSLVCTLLSLMMQLGQTIFYSDPANAGRPRLLIDILLLVGVPLVAVLCAALAWEIRRNNLLTICFATPLILLGVYHVLLTLSRL